ncbi:hypothetical protein [Agaribacter marinus]|uniref:Uncharacterized protein n=1 Tax=Agaribacter marinus TaxID=1431249 RepID=A0AA37T583_9ALTE|nr:hypothetical protein [Agaribacter marinus]GLR72203.1 hypothetical protein GCM10007852_31110 [Agaribacter marinus]
MGILKSIKKKYVAHKFSSENLNIIQDIQGDTFVDILSAYRCDGWELVTDYRDFDASINKWQGKLRKGSIVLVLDWNQHKLGQVVGPERVIMPLSKAFSLQALKRPK